VPTGTAGSTVGGLFRREERGRQCIEVDRLIGNVTHALGVGGPRHPHVGRYLLGERIGAGGFGIVYRASDPRLGRDVAIKILKDANGSSRLLLDEARALASVVHPNVLQVFDAGSFDDHGIERGYVAMELLLSGDLARWLGNKPSVPEIVTVFAAAARGLHAAHECGVLHRDFKPSNVLVSDDGSVRVADFGLAAMDDGSQTLPGSASGQTLPPAAGTARYMPPEQHQRAALSPASDQYAFFVSLYEALHGRPPFVEGEGTLLDAKLAGPVTLAFDVGLPAALVAAIRRGLSPSPDDRFASMARARVAIERSHPGRKGPARVVFGLATVVSALVLAQPDTGPQGCAEPPALASVAPSGDLDASLRSRQDELDRELVAYHDEIEDRWRGVCAGPERARSRAQVCLTDASLLASQLRTTVARDRSAVVAGWRTIEQLPDVSGCEDPTTEARARRWGSAKERAELYTSLGEPERARALWLELREDARSEQELRHVELGLARVSFAEGGADAVERYESVYFASDAAGDAHAAATVAITLVAAHARQGHAEPAAKWQRAARAQLDRTHPPDPAQELNLAHNVALADLAIGKLARARVTLEHALDHAAELELPTAQTRATHQLYAEVLLQNGRPREAIAVHRRSLALDEGRRPLDDEVVTILSLGSALMAQQDHEAACEVLGDAHTRAGSVFGPDHPVSATAAINLSICRLEGGDADAAAEVLEPARQSLVQTMGEDHPYTAVADVVLGRIESVTGRPEGVPAMLRAVERLEAALGAQHYLVLDARFMLANEHARAGRDRVARELHEAVWASRLEVLPAGHVDIDQSRAHLAVALATEAAYDRAVPLMHEALGGFRAHGVDAHYVASFTQQLETWP